MGSLSVVDLSIVAATLVLALGTGLLLGWRAKSATTTRSFLVAEHDLPWWAVLLSIVATETSSVTFLSVPGISFGGDLRFLQLPLGYLVGRLFVARFLLPGFFQGDALTTYEVLGRRFGSGVKRASSLVFLITRNGGDGLRLYLTALPLQKLTGLPLPAAIGVMSLVTIAYTFVGGMRAVVWTDVVQFFIYVAGGVLALVVAAGDGGIGGVLAESSAHGKLACFDFSFDLASANTFWAGLIGGAFLTIATHGTDQLMVQRYLGARDVREARRALLVSGVVVLLQFALFLLVGLALAVWFRGHPEIGPIAKGDDAFSTFIARRLTQIPGAIGLIFAALFAVSMSTLSSSLNASAGALVNDWLKPTVARNWDDARTLRATRLATLGFGVAQAAAALAGASLKGNVVSAVLTIAGFTTGLTLGLFFLARWLGKAPADRTSARSQGVAALAAFLVMLAVMTCVWRGTTIAWPWYSLIGSVGTLLVGRLLAALLVRRSPKMDH